MGSNMEGKVCLVTGGTSGIGLHAAIGLAKIGAQVVLVGRSRKRGRRALELVRRASSNGSTQYLSADLSSRSEVQDLSQTVRQRFSRLDVLLNNAGGVFLRREQSADGLEMTFALNHLSYFRLSNQLIDLLKESAPSRIVNVSSAAHLRADLNLEDLELQKGYGAMLAYRNSKLANLLFTYELARRIEGSAVTVNALHPGFVSTNLGKQYWFARPFVSLIFALFGMHPEEGARTPLYLASSHEVEGVTGKYFVKRRPVPSSRKSYEVGDARRLWEISERYG